MLASSETALSLSQSSALPKLPPRATAEKRAKHRQLQRRHSLGSSGTPESGSGSDHGQPRKDRLAAKPQNRETSLLLLNRVGFLPAIAQDPNAASLWFEHEVDRVSNEVDDRGGCVDSLYADHFSATFGAVRQNPSHRRFVVPCARRIEAAGGTGSQARDPLSDPISGLTMAAACCAGRALCGDFGSNTARRFMVLGGVGSLLLVAERLATGWGGGIVLDDVVYHAAQEEWYCRIREQVTYPKRGSQQPLALWQVVAPAISSHPQQKEVPGEPISDGTATSGSNVWRTYNEAFRLWSDGQRQLAAALVAEAGANLPDSVLDALADLRGRI
eukprot:gene57523-biopygen20794